MPNPLPPNHPPLSPPPPESGLPTAASGLPGTARSGWHGPGPLFGLVLGLGSAAQLLGPPWVLALVAFAGALVLARPGSRPGLAGLLAGFVSWGMPAAFFNQQNHGLLAGRVAQLLPLGGQSWAVVLVSGVLGGLLGWAGAWAGAAVRRAVVAGPELA